uniref:Uncharacterized protein n=1 Tax=Siphoviridae sp. ctL0q1 TaxID=2825449 RepID=A0A8S5PIY3_9CAUD|nr:MAG TPA: hypothetical protein [Siphoviridae sp. ctL0q1]
MPRHRNPERQTLDHPIFFALNQHLLHKKRFRSVQMSNRQVCYSLSLNYYLVG